jgi:hypothetical protein
VDRLFGALGKQPPQHDIRTLRLATYLTPSLPPAPEAALWIESMVDWQVLANDKFGTCVPAGALHLAQNWVSYAGGRFMPTDEDAVEAYHRLNPGWSGTQDKTDTGACMLAALKLWRKEGLAGDRISAFMACDRTDREQVKQAIALLGGAYIGLDLPRSCRDQDIWSVPEGGATGDGARGSLGGHCVPVLAYSPRTLTCLTWGQLVLLTWDFFTTYCDEAYAVLSPGWFDATGCAPNGFDRDQLRRDLTRL